jgi:hypothetical protein
MEWWTVCICVTVGLIDKLYICIYSNVIFLFPTVDLTERTQRYEIFSLLLSVCMVAIAFKAVFKGFGRVCGYDVNCHSHM